MGGEAAPGLEVFENNPLLSVGVKLQGFGGEIGGDLTAEILVILTEHVDEVMLAEELLAEGVADEVKGVGANVGEDFIREIGAVNVENIATDNVIGRNA